MAVSIICTFVNVFFLGPLSTFLLFEAGVPLLLRLFFLVLLFPVSRFLFTFFLLLDLLLLFLSFLSAFFSFLTGLPCDFFFNTDSGISSSDESLSNAPWLFGAAGGLAFFLVAAGQSRLAMQTLYWLIECITQKKKLSSPTCE